MAAALKLSRKLGIDVGEINGIINQFNNLDLDTRESASQQDVQKYLTANPSEKFPYDQVRETLKSPGLVDAAGRLEVAEYVELVVKLRQGHNRNAGVAVASRAGFSGGPVGGDGASAAKRRVEVGGVAGKHTMDEDERREFTRHINQVLAGDADIGNRLPIPTDTMQLFDECRDGLVLSKLINDAVPDTIDERVLNKPTPTKAMNAFKINENNNIVIASAKGIGCSTVNIGSEDLKEGTEHLILGLIWQIIRRGLLSKIDIKIHPELYRLLEDDETLEQFLRLPPDQILLRWFNYHLKAANWERRVANFSRDVSDAENYTVLLNQLKPAECSRSPLQQRDPLQRAEMVLQNAERIGCRKYLTPSAIVAGNPKLNLAFVANLFNTWPGLEPLQETEKPVIDDFDAEGEREARVFTLWLNSLDVDPGVYNLFEDLKDGTVLLQAFDKVVPGSVSWRRVSKPREGQELSRFKCVENTNYAVDLGKVARFSLPGIQGADIVDGNKTLTLGLVWQLMRKHVIGTLSSLNKAGRDVTDADMVRWGNDMVKKAGKTNTVQSFRDPKLQTALFYLDVLEGMKPGYVDYSLVLPGRTEDERKNNAKLAISIARKVGAIIFVVPEDLIEGRQRLILTFIGALMTVRT